MRYWGLNILIDGSTIREQFEDPVPTMGPPPIVTHDTSNPNAGAYEFITQEVLRKIQGTLVGAILIQRINSLSQTAAFTVTIRPLNEKAIGLTRTFATDETAARQGHEGSSATIWYDPTTWTHAAAKVGYDPANFYQPDDVLFHELVHALRMMRGMIDLVTIRDWDNVEDLYAILLTNIYLSSNGRDRDLRGDHAKLFHKLRNSYLRPTEQMSDQTFYIEYGPDIDRLCNNMPDLCGPISQIQCHFNPLRARVNLMNSPLQRAFQQVNVRWP